jgi:hypothetical protein
MWEPRRLTTLSATTVCYSDSFIFICLGYREKTAEVSVTISNVPAQIQNEHITNKILERYHLTSLFGVVVLVVVVIIIIIIIINIISVRILAFRVCFAFLRNRLIFQLVFRKRLV